MKVKDKKTKKTMPGIKAGHKSGSIFFMRLIMFFFAVLLASFSAVLVVNNRYIDQKGVSQMDAEALLVMFETESFIDEKIGAVKHMISILYNSRTFQRIPDGLAAPPAAFSRQGIEFSSVLDEYLQLGIASDADIASIAISAGASGKTVMLASGMTHPGTIQKKIQRHIEQNESVLREYGPTLMQGFEDDSYAYPRYVLPTLSKVKSANMAETVGYLSVDFSLARIDARVQRYRQLYPGGRLYVADSGGVIIYDSERAGIGGQLGMAEGLDGLGGLDGLDGIEGIGGQAGEIRGSNYLRAFRSQKIAALFATVTPLQPMRAELLAQKLPIYAAIAALLAMGMLATALYVKRYSRRISALSNAMGRAREGVLDQRIPPDDCRDEISMLAESFNEMCEMLEVYIEEVYVSEIKSKKSALARMDAEIRQRNARLYALQTQINPHFLYNSLESIRMRALSKGERELAQMANILSDLFRNSLKSDFVISVEDEMENCRLYAKLALLRFPDSLEIELDADGSTLCLAIPSLVLQPLVENSVNHGLRSDGRKNRITVSSRREREQGGEVLVVRVSDNGRGIEGEKLAEYRAALEEKQEQSQSIMSRRIGLANVNQRIRMLFGESWGLGIESDLGAGTIVTMRAPAVDRRKLDCRNDEIPSIDR